MAAPKGRAVAPARPLLYLAGADGLVFLAASSANLLPLMPLDGPIPFALAWTGAVLVTASVLGFVAGLLLGRPGVPKSRVVAASLGNAILIAVVAVYFSVAFQLFGGLGPAFLLLAAPGFVAAWMIGAT